ncbi:MAG: hypothetical protein NTZ21_08460 [Actinobacteria bacterium]|nr:hypothetical protein [Actinomycetota bacterium]
MKPKFDLVECGLCLIGATVMVSQMAVRIPSNHSSAVSGRVETAQVASVSARAGSGDGTTQFGASATAVIDMIEPVGAPRLSGVAAHGECASELLADELDTMLNATPAGFSGSDYPHAYPLGEGRILWLFQDVFHGGGDTLSEAAFAHNGGFVQTGGCVQSLQQGVAVEPRSLVGGDLEVRRHRWFWPLDGEIGADGNLWVFFAEMANPNGTGAAMGAVPIGTWVVVFDPGTLEIVSFERAADDSAALYGWSIASDEQYSYLFGHCYRQFVPDTPLGLDPSCSPHVVLARVPLGEFDAAPEYFVGSGSPSDQGEGWGRDPSSAVPVSSRGLANGASVERFGNAYVSVTKVDDWFGDELVVSVAAAPEGPWHDVASHPVSTRCGRCNTYGTFVMPWLEDGRLVVAVSNNSFEMQRDAFSDATLYRPSIVVLSIDA